MSIPIEAQIKVMQHFAAGGRCEHRVLNFSLKCGPTIWQECTRSYMFDWENEEIRIKTTAPVSLVVDGVKYVRADLV